MTKTSFYSVMVKDGKKQAVLHHGYSDGTYYYYKSEFDEWHAIHPLNGLSVGKGYTRKEAVKQAYLPRVQEWFMKQPFEYLNKISAEFERLIQEAKQ